MSDLLTIRLRCPRLDHDVRKPRRIGGTERPGWASARDAEEAQRPMGNGSILIVDDESSLRKVLSDLFRLRGYSPEPVATGREAIDRVVRTRHAVAIVDLGLGEEDMSGIEVIREIRSKSPETECIVLTGNPSAESEAEAAEAGACSYLKKPFNVMELLETIAGAVQRSRDSVALAKAEAEKTPATEGTDKLQQALSKLTELAES